MPESPPIRCTHTRLIPTAEAMLLRRENNPNRHPPEQLRILGKIIGATGWRSPVVISKRSGRMTKGHGRTEAAALAGFPFVPIDEQDYESDEQELADVLADNFIAAQAELDPVMAKEIADALSAAPDFDAELAGLTNEMFADLVAPPPSTGDAEPQIDRAAELNKVWQVKPGDLWRIGFHRLACGDSTKAEDVTRLMDGATADMIYSDAPYGISIVSTTAMTTSISDKVGPALRRTGKVEGDKSFGKVGTIHRGMKAKPIIASNLYPEIIGDDDGATARASYRLLTEMFPSAVNIWWGANHFSDAFPPSSCWIVWDKDNSDSFFADAELAFCSAESAVRIFKHTWNGLIKESERGQRRVHPTQKPIALAAWCLTKYGEAEDITLDPFLGSGTTMVACQNLWRKCRGLEISPDYCAVILQRMKDAFPGIAIERI